MQTALNEEVKRKFFPEGVKVVERPDLTGPPILASVILLSLACQEQYPDWVEIPSVKDSWKDLAKYLYGLSETLGRPGSRFEVIIERRVRGVFYGYNRVKVSEGTISLDAFDPKTGKVPSLVL